MEANLHKDAAAVDEVIHILAVLREGWASLKQGGQERGEEGLPRRVDIQM